MNLTHKMYYLNIIFAKRNFQKNFQLVCKNDTFHGMKLDTIGGSVFEK